MYSGVPTITPERVIALPAPVEVGRLAMPKSRIVHPQRISSVIHEHDVRRLEIAMHDVQLVRIAQAHRRSAMTDAPAALPHGLRGFCFFEIVVQRQAIEELHHEVTGAIGQAHRSRRCRSRAGS